MTIADKPHSTLMHRLNIGGPGPTVVVKDCIDVAGDISTCGTAAFAAAPAAFAHADVVQNVLDAGCHIVGKAKMHELAFGMTGVNAAFGTPINPSWPDRIPGGSSSGSAAAVAAGLCDFAIGTDTGGSVRQPATCCGVFGIKPTFGRISRKGCTPKESSLDCVGVFSRSAPMLTTAMKAIDPDFSPMTLTSAPRIKKIAGPADPFIQALVDLVHREDEITLPHLDPAFDAGMAIIGAETFAAFGSLLATDAPMGADVRARLEQGRTLTQKAIAEAEKVRTIFTAEVDAALETCDALISAALPILPPTLEEAKNPSNLLPLSRFIRPFNLSGHPALVLPATIGPNRLPAGIQIIGRKDEDALLCAIAEHLAQSHPTVFSGPSDGGLPQ